MTDVQTLIDRNLEFASSFDIAPLIHPNKRRADDPNNAQPNVSCWIQAEVPQRS